VVNVTLVKKGPPLGEKKRNIGRGIGRINRSQENVAGGSTKDLKPRGSGGRVLPRNKRAFWEEEETDSSDRGEGQTSEQCERAGVVSNGPENIVRGYTAA